MASVIGDPRLPEQTSIEPSTPPAAVPLVGPTPEPLPSSSGAARGEPAPGRSQQSFPRTPADVGRGLRPVAPSEIVKRTVRYGSHRSQTGRLRRPRWPVAERLPVVVLVHGGSWSWPSNRRLVSWIGRDVVRRGWCSFEIGYRRLGRFGGSGGYPASFDDVVDAVRVLADETPIGVDPERIVVVGHSAGAHLALAVAGRLSERVLGVVGVSTPTDLRRAVDAGSTGAARLIDGADGAWERVSPMEMSAPGCELALVHSTSDATVRADHSVRYAERLRDLGVPVDVRLVGREGHRSGLRPSSATWTATADIVSGWIAGATGRPARRPGRDH